MPVQRPPPGGKYIGGWRNPSRAFPAADEVRGRRRAADQEHPDVVVRPIRSLAPAQVVQRVLDRLAERRVNAMRQQPVEARALVDFVEVRQRLAVEQHALAVARSHRRAVAVVERALDQVAGRQQVLQPLLILNADRVAAEVIGEAHRRDVHLGTAAGPARRVRSRRVRPDRCGTSSRSAPATRARQRPRRRATCIVS